MRKKIVTGRGGKRLNHDVVLDLVLYNTEEYITDREHTFNQMKSVEAPSDEMLPHKEPEM